MLKNLSKLQVKIAEAFSEPKELKNEREKFQTALDIASETGKSKPVTVGRATVVVNDTDKSGRIIEIKKGKIESEF